MHCFVVLFVSVDWSKDVTDTEDDIDDDDESEGRYDRRQNVRDADDLRQSLQQRLATSQSVLSLSCSVWKLIMQLVNK